MNVLTVVLPEPIVRALCWTLIYSLCWGVVAAALTGIMLLLTKKLRSSVRYFFLVGIMGLFVLASAFTFFQQLAIPSPSGSFSAAVSAALPGGEPETSLAVISDQSGIGGAFAFFCNQHATLIVSLWLLAIALQCARMMVDWRRVHSLTKRQVIAPGDHWNDRLGHLSAQLGIDVPVRLLQSRIVKVPVTLGHLKPIILVPIGILSGMPQAHVEAVLLHELAHIRRNDYLVNILMRFVEILFFFNPAMWWLSSLIREERENCCDDIVISQTDNRTEYINTLVAFQEYATGFSTIVPAFANQKGHLLARVRRIMFNTNKTMGGREKLLLIAGMAVAGFFFFSSLKVKDKVVIHAMDAHPGGIVALMPIIRDTLPTRHDKAAGAGHVMEAAIAGKHFRYTVKNGVIAEMIIDGKKVPEDELGSYQSLAIVTEILSHAPQDMKMRKMDAEKALKGLGMDTLDTDAGLLMQKENAERLFDDLKANSMLQKLQSEQLLDKLQAEQLLMKMQAEQLPKNVQIEKLLKSVQTDQLLGNVQADQLLNKLQAEQLLKNIQTEQLLNKLQTDQLLKKGQAEQLQDMQANQRLAQEQIGHLLENMDAQRGISLEKYIDPIVEDLIRDKVIDKKESDNFSFELDKDGLTVNGVRQPEELFMKYKEKYIRKPNDHFSYTVKNKTSKTMTVSVN